MCVWFLLFLGLDTLKTRAFKLLLSTLDSFTQVNITASKENNQ